MMQPETKSPKSKRPAARRRGVALCLGLLLLSIAPPEAEAQADKAAAEALFREAKGNLDAGEIDVACAKLAESLRLDRALGTLLNLARCHQLQGKTATAWAEYREVAELAAKAEQTERADGAAALAEELEPRLSKLRVDAPGAPPGLAVARGGVALGDGGLGVSLPIDPGDHELTASAPGFEPWATTISVGADADAVVVTIPALVRSKEQPAAMVSTDDAGGLTRRHAGLVLGGLGVAALGVGAVFGVMTLSETSAAREDPALCPGSVCSPAGRAAIDSAEGKGIVSTIALGVGGAALVSGAILFLTAPSGEPQRPVAGRLELTPSFGPLGGGLSARTRF